MSKVWKQKIDPKSDLTSGDKALKLHERDERNLTRRNFLRNAGLGLAGFTILPSLGGLAAPSDRVRVAHIGINGMGNNHMNWFANLPNVEIAALCDVEELHLNKTFE